MFKQFKHRFSKTQQNVPKFENWAHFITFEHTKMKTLCTNLV